MFLSLHTRPLMDAALKLNLDPELHRLLAQRITNLSTPYGDLSALTHILIVGAEVTEGDLVREIGFSPLVNPLNGARYRSQEWAPWHDYAIAHDGWIEILIAAGGTGFCYVLLIDDSDSPESDIVAMAREAVR